MKMDKCFVLEPSNGYWGLATSEFGKEKLKEHLKSLKKPEKRYKGIQIVALNTTNQCNLGCIYCSTKNLRSEEHMSFEVSKKVLDGVVAFQRTPKIIFHGSEPLFNWSLIKETVEYGKSLPSNQPNFYLQSNLTLLDQEKIDFISRHHIGVSSSLDGCEQEHNLNRPYRNGRPTYFDVLKNIQRIIEMQGGIHVVTVVTSNNVKNFGAIVRDFEERGITSVQFIPSVSCSADKDYRPSKSELAESYVSLFEQTFRKIEKGEQKLRITNLGQYLSALFVNSGSDCCRACTSADEHPIIAIDTFGDIYPCDFFFGNKSYSCGNIMSDSLVSIMNDKRNIRMKPIEETSCRGCDWKNNCGGGCLADRIFSGGHPYYCETNKRVFEYLSKKLPYLIDSGLLGKILEENQS